MEYQTVQEAAQRWGLSVRRVQFLCQKNMIPETMRISGIWMIPKQAEKPQDKRYRTDKKSENRYASQFQNFIDNADMLKRIIEFFPYAIQVYTPDGTLVLTNEACLRLLHIPSKDHIIGKFNVLRDSVIDKWGEGVREIIEKSFEGKTVHFQDLQAPIQDIMNRFETDDLYFDSSYLNITCYPVFDDNKRLMYVVHVFAPSKVYNGKAEMIKAKEYIDRHWLKEFDLDEVAEAVYMSKYHFVRLFKRYTSMTPYRYYQNIKIGKIKEKLMDKNLSIHEAFAECGVDYSGNYARLFREKTGMTPTKFRNTLVNK